MLSVVIPTLNAATTLPATIAALDGAADEIIVADGGSTDGTIALAWALGARVVQAGMGQVGVIRAGSGHGTCLAAGCAAARGDWLLLLGPDTRLAPGWVAAAERLMSGMPTRAGYFRFSVEAGEIQARRLERVVAWRGRVLGLPAAEQGLLIPRVLLDAVGGVRPIPVMAELDLARRLGARRLAGLQVAAISGGASWRRAGWARRVMRELGCVVLYFLGLPPGIIARMHG